ncbi:MAG: cyclic nucleotide-binding domain-containing protein [Actinomycetota bacterium]
MTRIDGAVLAVTWIPREAVEGPARLPFQLGLAHFDDPPPERIDDEPAFLIAGEFTFANDVRAWIEVEDGAIVDRGVGGGVVLGHRARAETEGVMFARQTYPVLRPDPQVQADRVRFVQTGGGSTGLAAPRRLGPRGEAHVGAPPAWTTVALTLHTDGRAEHEVIGASAFPRHWIYDDVGRLQVKTALIEFDDWFYRDAGRATPWGGVDTPALVATAESALERRLSQAIIGTDPPFRRLRRGEELVRQGDEGGELFLLFDGVLEVERDGEVIARLGPGAVVGEAALLSGGVRNATLRAITAVRVAAVPGDRIDRGALAALFAQREVPGGS